MKIFKQIAFCICLAMSLFAVKAQQVTDLRLNEILIKNDSNYVDEYGRNVAWVEVFNTAYNSVNIGGCFLTNDTTGIHKADESMETLKALKNRWYAIPNTDPKTNMPQRSHLVFFLDAKPTYGTFHTNFLPEETNYIALISSNGKDIIDILEFPNEIRQQCVSYGCVEDGKVEDRQILDFFTPASANKIMASESKADKLKETDPHGLSMTLISVAIVFAVLTIVFFMLKIFGLVAKRREEKEKAQKAAATAAPVAKPATTTSSTDLTDEAAVAIAMALYLHMGGQHDQESEVITFAHNASPWASKASNFTPTPHKN